MQKPPISVTSQGTFDAQSFPGTFQSSGVRGPSTPVGDIEADLENRSNGASPLKKIKTLTFVPSDLSVDRGLQQLMMTNQHKTMAVTIALTSPSF
jgi:hypothetical protein